MQDLIDKILGSDCPFEVLGIKEDGCTERICKLGYMKMALMFHPDKCSHVDAEAVFKKIGEANEIVKKHLTNCSIVISHTHTHTRTTTRKKTQHNTQTHNALRAQH